MNLESPTMEGSIAPRAGGAWLPMPEPRSVPSEPARHPRTRILEEVRQQPGSSITDLARVTGLGHTTVCHHLAVLTRRGMIVRERWGGTVRVFPADLTPVHRALLAQARAGRTGEVLRAIATTPRATPSVLARALGLHRQAVQWHLVRLEKAGIIRVDREHRPYRIQLHVRPETVLRLLPPPGREPGAGAAAEPPGPAPPGPPMGPDQREPGITGSANFPHTGQ